MQKRIIAIYLPQFHPFTENNEWWGKGFTEWTNVTKSKPRFNGHYQPHLPTSLGFYDLRLPEVREEQAIMAKDCGIYGFCYYHYWFGGKVLMERPMKEVLESHKPDFPFMICWANENWTRAWSEQQGEREILIEQTYSDEDARNHIHWMIPYLKDSRYIRVNNKPVIAIYRTTSIPNIDSMVDIWREECKKENIDLYIIRFESFVESGNEYLHNNIDAAAEFKPHDAYRVVGKHTIIQKIKTRLQSLLGLTVTAGLFDYQKYVDYQIKGFRNSDYKLYPCICPRFDNSPRRKNKFWAFINESPAKYGEWLKYILLNFKPYSEDENFIFINAWNEWAEGNHLEPDNKFGSQYLDVTKEVIEKYNR